MKRTHPCAARRGVLLLVVLGMLAMFGVVAITFVILTSHERRGAESARRVEQYSDPPDDLLNQAMLQALRGTENTASVLRPHGLLEDLYGYPDDVLTRQRNGLDDDDDGVIDDADEAPFEIMALSNIAPAVSGGQLFQLYLTLPNDSDANGNHTNGFNVDPMKYVGCVITMLTGPAAGRSSRIVGINPVVADRRAQVLSFDGVIPQMGDRFIINGTPFSGTGFGYDPTAGGASQTEALLTATLTKLTPTDPIDHNWPYALLPNPAAFTINGPYTDPAGLGGANEDYDAPDYQNMLLALQVFNGTITTTPIPSLHRPELVQYWFSQLDTGQQSWFKWPQNATSPSDKFGAFMDPYRLNTSGGGYYWVWEDIQIAHRLVQLKRRIILRPLPELNDGFTGSNTAFNPMWDVISNPNGFQWDVDNDGDGVTDSIWVDLGMPARSTKDGRLFKPLFAILCVDLDGRLNLNAHGCLAQTDPNYQNPSTFQDASGNALPIVAGGASQMVTPRGQGCGPAEINLGALVPNTVADPQYARLLTGNGTLAGRYGASAVPGLAGADALSRNLLADYPNNWDLTAMVSTTEAMAYGTPMDLRDGVAVGLDLRGQPLYAWAPAATWWAKLNMGTDQPYEFNLSGPTAADTPFSVAELERVLRPFDADAGGLPDRIKQLAPSLLTTLSRRHEVTTESWSLPCPSVVVPPEMRGTSAALVNNRASHVVDLLRAKGPSLTEAQIAQLLPSEMLAGLKMDLNRPFGNGRDDNGNGVVDEPNENEQSYQAVSASTPPGGETAYPFGADVDGDGTAGTANDQLLARQLYARHLYVQMLVLMNYDPDYDDPDPDAPDAEDYARQVAQWAVNIVDFRDRDAIMTAFEYDLNPFDGWSADGDPGTPNSGCDVVWGCERPELLITETLAIHDRRTEDLAADGGTVDKDDAHEDFDQQYVPQGSLFVELYNPSTMQEPPPGELSDGRGIALDSSIGGSPVWRMVIVEGAEAGKDPDDPDTSDRPTLLRAVYFVAPAVALPADPADPAVPPVHFQPSTAAAKDITPIYPGHYALVGPGEPTETTSTTYVGFRADGLSHGDDRTRRIILNKDKNQVEIRSDGMAKDYDSKTIQAVTPVLINEPRRLSVSEPDDGYDTAYDPKTGLYGTIQPQPSDLLDGTLWEEVRHNKRYNGRFVVHLQRLANPLMPYVKDTNPYRTIDSMPIDLTAFNGATTKKDKGETGDDAPLLSRERGEHNHGLWSEQVAGEAPQPNTFNVPPPLAQTHHFNQLFHHTLGYLNEPFGLPQDKDSLGNPLPAAYVGSPGPAPTNPQPFPWFTWLNRPFTSEMELTLVPKWRSSQLLKHFGDASGGVNAYTESDQPFSQMINFFYDDDTLGTGHPVTDTPNWKLHRLLEMVEVPSRFVGTELQGPPGTFAVAGNHAFHPPFNRIPTYREPGKVNINTIVSHDAWRGLMNMWPGATDANETNDTLWNNLLASRRGCPGTTYAINPTYPTRFANPFRSYAGRYMVPDVAPGNMLQSAIPREIDATLLRANPTTPEQPLFELPATASTTYNDRDKNPYFRYQVLQRLGSLVTTRSNVYAMWITVGYFEVKPTTDLANHPDGYQLGQELGADTGETKRHRAFYIIDRSIPVGFQRGKDLNVEDAVLLKRYIE